MTGSMDNQPGTQRAERWELLRKLDRALDGPLIVLSFIWLALLLVELAAGTDPRLDPIVYAIWFVFIAEVIIELIIAPDRAAYLRSNILKVLSLVVPALRALRVVTVLRFLRATRAVRSASLLRLLTTINRGMAALAETLDRTRFTYAAALTALVMFVGAAGMLYFERPSAADIVAAGGRGLTSYGDALWWSAMAMTTVGTDYFPVTPEGRLLGWLLSVFALGVFGYVTATIATHFIGPQRAPGSNAFRVELRELQAEVVALRRQLERQVVKET